MTNFMRKSRTMIVMETATRRPQLRDMSGATPADYAASLVQTSDEREETRRQWQVALALVADVRTRILERRGGAPLSIEEVDAMWDDWDEDDDD